MAKRRPEHDEDYDDDYGDDYGDWDDSGSPKGPPIGLIAVVIVVVIVASGGLLLVSAKSATIRRARATQCANNLRQLGLASLQYGDDKRFLPHVGPTLQLDGDADSDDSSRVINALVFYGYHDAPEGFVCPVSEDAAATTNTIQDLRTWTWQGGLRSDPGTSPILDRAPMPTLRANSELSYAYTRRGLNCSARSTTIVAADKSYQQHADDPGRNVLQVDATVQWLSADLVAEQQGLASTVKGPGSGYLPLVD